MTGFLKSILKSQMLAALKTLQQIVTSCDEATWAADHVDTAVNQVVFHTLFYTDVYLSRGVAEFREQDFHRENTGFFRDYEELEDRIPTNFYEKADCVRYYEFCVRKAELSIEHETEETLVGGSGFEWRKCSRAELHIYNTRHIQHHAAQLGLRRQLEGGEPLRWIGEG